MLHSHRKDQNAEMGSQANLEAAAEFALEQGLRYVTDSEPGFSRRKVGKGFAYFTHQSQRLTCERQIARIHSLVIPPAWQTVWICRHSNGHLQVTGRDARARKQYRYHPDWYRSRNEDKFSKLEAFGHALPSLRKTVEKHLQLRGMPQEKVLAAVVGVLEQTRIRIGNEAYTRQNKSYGLTTILNKHAQVKGAKVRFQFRGKSGVERDLELVDARLSRIIRNCQELPGEELFCYQDADGSTHDIDSTLVNSYLREISGQTITAKNFRTWGGTVKAIEMLLSERGVRPSSERGWKQRELSVIKGVSSYLGNTVSVCRKYYVAPAVFTADREGQLQKIYKKEKAKRSSLYSPEEQVLLQVLAKS